MLLQHLPESHLFNTLIESLKVYSGLASPLRLGSIVPRKHEEAHEDISISFKNQKKILI